jgi:hypothetical protein
VEVQIAKPERMKTPGEALTCCRRMLLYFNEYPRRFSATAMSALNLTFDANLQTQMAPWCANARTMFHNLLMCCVEQNNAGVDGKWI